MPTASVTHDFVPLTLIESAKVDVNFQDLVSFINTNMIQKDASVAFTAVPSGPALNPTAANQFTRKAYVDVPRYVGQVLSLATTSTGGAGTYVAISGAGWSTVSSNRITPTTAGCTILETGLYEVTAITEHFFINNTWRGVRADVNGAGVAQDPRGAGVNGTTPTCIATTTRVLTAGNTIRAAHGHDNSIGATMNAFLYVIGVQGTF